MINSVVVIICDLHLVNLVNFVNPGGVDRAAQAFKKPLGNKKEERLQK